MSLQRYNAAKKILDSHEGDFFQFKKQPEALLKKAEQTLSLTFPQDYRQFTLDYGTVTIEGNEIYGLTSDDFINSGVPNVVWVTLTERINAQMRMNLLPIYDTTVGEYFALDFSRLNANGEPKIVSYFPDFEEAEQKYEIIADNFGEFLVELVEELGE